MAQHDKYISPFSTRYASDEMQYIFSDDNKFRTWRRLWIALAKAEQKQGLAITDEQLAELEAHKDDINYEDAIAREKLVRHDVMSHVYAYGLQCPKAAGIIHLGATSCYVGDNTDIILMREALEQIRSLLVNVIQALADFAARTSKSRASRRAIIARRNSALSIPASSSKPAKKGQVYFGRFYLGKRDMGSKATANMPVNCALCGCLGLCVNAITPQRLLQSQTY